MVRGLSDSAAQVSDLGRRWFDLFNVQRSTRLIEVYAHALHQGDADRQLHRLFEVDALGGTLIGRYRLIEIDVQPALDAAQESDALDRAVYDALTASCLIGREQIAASPTRSAASSAENGGEDEAQAKK
jgi:hypothetical protein